MNKSPVPAVGLTAGKVFEGKSAAVAVGVAQVIGIPTGVTPVVVDGIGTLNDHIAVASFDVPTLCRANIALHTYVSSVGTASAEVLSVVEEVPGAV